MSASVFTTRKTTWAESVASLLDRSGLCDKIDPSLPVIIKPNLVEALEPPITTPVGLIAAVVDYLRDRVSGCRIIVGEGTGSVEYDTFHCYSTLGYSEMAREKGIELMDLNVEPLVKKSCPDCKRWPEMHLPAILDEAFLLSVPVLKAHSLAKVTLTMKNMMGCAPPSHYRQGNSWGKSAFHTGMQEAVFDLNRYRTPDFTLLDASIGMAEAHLWGAHCNPPVGLLVAGDDPVAIDAYGCTLLQRDWRKVGHVRMADNVLGTADGFAVIEV